MPGVTIIIPTWNRQSLLEKLLGFLRLQTHPIEEVLVIDNGSDDGSIETAQRAGARVISMGTNRGFAAAVNRGIQEARTELLAIVNNDVEPAVDWLEKLVSGLDQGDAWFATGKTLSAAEPHLLDGTYDLLSRGACAWRAGQGRPDGPAWNITRPIQFAPFTAAIFRAELFQKVGLLDESFVSYLEDVDFGLRCALRGLAGIYVPHAVAYHQGSATLGVWHKDTVRRIARNQLLLVAKHYPWRCLVRYGWAILVGQLLWAGVAVRHGRGLAFLRGKLEGARLLLVGQPILAAEPGIQNWTARKGADPKLLSSILEGSELEIGRLQRSTGYDWYWRLTLALT